MERSEIVHLQNKHDDVCIICNTSFFLVKMTVKTMEGSEQVGNFLYLSPFNIELLQDFVKLMILDYLASLVMFVLEGMD